MSTSIAFLCVASLANSLAILTILFLAHKHMKVTTATLDVLFMLMLRTPDQRTDQRRAIDVQSWEN